MRDRYLTCQLSIMGRKPTSYWDYIKVDTLLSLQGGLANDDSALSDDEVLFITVHQIDELWFKLLVRQLVTVRDLFARREVPEEALASAARGLTRIRQVFAQLASHFELMETMTTRDYLAFRSKLYPASGFQSAQLREVEILFGLDDAERIALGHESTYLQALQNADGSPSLAYEKVAARLKDLPTLRTAIHDWLYRTPIDGTVPGDPDDEANVARFIEAYCLANDGEIRHAQSFAMHDALTDEDRGRLEARYKASMESARSFLRADDVAEEDRAKLRRIRASLVFIESYRELPLLSWPREIIDGLVAVEQSFVVFRQRHARMVERVIGRRTGTGGSAGVDYLDNTALKYRIFKDVWAVRTLLIPEESLPGLRNLQYYGLARGSIHP